jgi:hypothetical protein
MEERLEETDRGQVKYKHFCGLSSLEELKIGKYSLHLRVPPSALRFQLSSQRKATAFGRGSAKTH